MGAVGCRGAKHIAVATVFKRQLLAQGIGRERHVAHSHVGTAYVREQGFMMEALGS